MNHRIFLIVCVMFFGAAFAQKEAVEQPAPADSTAIAEQPAERQGLDIDKLLAEDEDGLLAEDEPAAAVLADTLSTVLDSLVGSAATIDSPLTPESAAAHEEGAGQDAASDSVGAVDPNDKANDAVRYGRGSRRAPEAERVVIADDKGPAIIEDGRTVNFAQNLAGYRSPKIAMALSLLVPGLGQAYSRSYTKAGAFAAAEIVVIGVSAYFNSLGKSKKKEAHKFADDNYDVARLRDYDARLQDWFEKYEIPVDSMTYPPYNDDFYNASKQGGRTSYFYESIRGMYFVPGWKDSDPAFDDIFSDKEEIVGKSGIYVRYNPDRDSTDFYFLVRIADEAGKAIQSGGAIIGYSNLQAEYSAMVNKANSYHDIANFTLYALLINHIASAIDAGFTARAYNAKLLGQESSVWDRITIEQQYVFTGAGMSHGLAFRVRF